MASILTMVVGQKMPTVGDGQLTIRRRKVQTVADYLKEG